MNTCLSVTGYCYHLLKASYTDSTCKLNNPPLCSIVLILYLMACILPIKKSWFSPVQNLCQSETVRLFKLLHSPARQTLSCSEWITIVIVSWVHDDDKAIVSELLPSWSILLSHRSHWIWVVWVHAVYTNSNERMVDTLYTSSKSVITMYTTLIHYSIWLFCNLNTLIDFQLANVAEINWMQMNNLLWSNTLTTK